MRQFNFTDTDEELSKEERLQQQSDEANAMMLFWEDRAIGKLTKAIRAIEDLPYEVLTAHKDDSEAIDDIVFKLTELRKIAHKRFRHWCEKYHDIEDQIESLDDDDDDDDDYPPYMPIEYSPCAYAPNDVDYISLGMGILGGINNE